VAQGWNRPEETKQTFHAYLADTGKGRFCNGDLGFFAAIVVRHTGRLKDLIIIRDKNYPRTLN